MDISTNLLFYSGNLVILNLVLQISLLAVVALLISRYLKHYAAARYSILFAAFLGIGLLSLSSVLMQSRAASLINIPVPLSFADFDKRRLQDELLSDILVPAESNPAISTAAGDIDAGSDMVSAGAEHRILELLKQIPPVSYVICIWLLGVLIALLGLGRSMQNIAKLRAQSRSLTSSERDKVKHCLSTLAENSKLQFRVSNQALSPMLVGFFRPAILLPKGLIESLDLDRLSAILQHEIAHLQRQDLFANLLQKIILAWFWFHPLVRLMDRKISRAREEICDNHVLAHQDGREYGEALLITSEYLSQQSQDRGGMSMAMSIFDRHWKLEHRIGELLDQARIPSIALGRREKGGLYCSTLIVTLVLAASQLTPVNALEIDQGANAASNPLSQDRLLAEIAANAIAVTYLRNEEFQRLQQNQSNSAGVLSEAVRVAIVEISELMSPEDENDEPNFPQAKRALDELRERRYQRMNDFEKSTLLNFYTNYYLSIDNLPGAIESFEEILGIENLREDTRLRALRSLGQLHGAEENWSDSVNSYQQWRDLSEEEDDVVHRGLAYAHYQLAQFADAELHWLAYMNMAEDEGKELSRNDYSFLYGIYISLEDNTSALDTAQKMIRLFNVPADWLNLIGVYNRLNNPESAAAIEQAYALIFPENVQSAQPN